MALVSLEERMTLESTIGFQVDKDVSETALWVATRYERANHPFYPRRSLEKNIIDVYAEHYGIIVSDEDFDWAMAIRFGGGMEMEWNSERG